MVDVRPNEITSQQVDPYVRRIDSYLRDLESEKGRYMNIAKGIRAQMRDVVKDAADAGIPRTAFKEAIETLKLHRKINKIRDELEEDMVEFHDQIITAIEGLEGLPLGDAAIAREKREQSERRTRRRRSSVDKLSGEANGDQPDTAH
jgi:hypothetical protein